MNNTKNKYSYTTHKNFVPTLILTFSSSDHLEARVVAKSEFTALNNELEARINALLGFFLN